MTFQLENTVLGSSQMVDFGPFGPGSDAFWVASLGVIDATDPFDRLTVLSSNSGEAFTVDDISAGLTVPTPVAEPASLTLLGLGLAGMAGRRWRQRKAS